MSNTSDADNRTVTIERTFNAPLQLVWEAWTNPEHIAQWWGPKGMSIEMVEHNFSVGGHWKYIMPMPDGNQFISEGIYSEIVELAKVVTSADFKPMTEGVVLHSLFSGDGEKTNFIFKVVHATEEYKEQQEKMGIYSGWGSAFDRLEAFLSA